MAHEAFDEDMKLPLESNPHNTENIIIRNKKIK
jgi:hypothetical protein